MHWRSLSNSDYKANYVGGLGWNLYLMKYKVMKIMLESQCEKDKNSKKDEDAQ